MLPSLLAFVRIITTYNDIQTRCMTIHHPLFSPAFFHFNAAKIVITGTSIQASQRALQLTTKYGTPGVLWSTAGVHPHDAKSCNDKTTIPTLRKIAKEPTCVAIGECGLDFDRNFSDPDVQEYWFEEQLKLAVELKMPLFLHERAAHASFVRILSKYRSQLKAPVCVHCFTGTKEELQSYIGLDCHIGITGWVCDPRRGQALRDALHLIPLDRLMIETDAPFLTPKVNQTLRHVSRNEPVLLPFVLDSIASLLKIPTAQLAHITTANALTFFGLDGDNNKTNNNGNVAATTET
jgi:TatD DNase family protein